MRAPFQILALPYRMRENWQFCVLRRWDDRSWQFVAGGGENDETPEEAALREIWEETGIRAENLMKLVSMSYLPVDVFSEECRRHWPEELYVLPEYCFAFECPEEITLSDEHLECAWLDYESARKCLDWDSNITALYELKRRLDKNR